MHIPAYKIILRQHVRDSRRSTIVSLVRKHKRSAIAATAKAATCSLVCNELLSSRCLEFLCSGFRRNVSDDLHVFTPFFPEFDYFNMLLAHFSLLSKIAALNNHIHMTNNSEWLLCFSQKSVFCEGYNS